MKTKAWFYGWSIMTEFMEKKKSRLDRKVYIQNYIKKRILRAELIMVYSSLS